jgi:ribosomal protein S12 methylthiotransferase accessory factor
MATRLIVLAAAALVWSVGRGQVPPPIVVVAALATGFVAMLVVIDLGRSLADRLAREGRPRVQDHRDDVDEPVELPVLVSDLTVGPASSSTPLVRIADLHTYPLFYEKTPAHVHTAFASFISRIDKIEHRYLHTFVTRTNGDAIGTGARFGAQEALQVSIYEAMERLFSTVYDPATLVHGAYAALGEAAVDPREMVLAREWEYDRALFPYVRYRDDLALSWVQGTEVSGGRLLPALLPATLAIRGYSLRRQSERFAPTLSAGTSSAGTYAEAVLRGLYELIERDAFAIAWLNRLSCPRIAVGPECGEAVTGASEALAADGFDVAFVDLTTDLGIPVVLTAVRRDQSMPEGAARQRTGGEEALGVAFGLGCSLDAAAALTHSFTEALAMLLNFYDFRDPTAVTPRRLHVRGIALDLDRYFAECAFLTAGSEVRELREMPSARGAPLAREFERCLGRCTAHGVRVFFVDQTPAMLRGAARYSLVRVLASRLQPHLYETDFWRLDNPRLTAAPVAMGRLGAPRQEEDLNLLPNPFAVYHRLE